MESFRGVLGRVMAGLANPETPQTKLSQNWEKIAGKKIASFSRAFVSKKKIIYVEVADGAQAFEMRQKYQAALLKRAQALLGNDEIVDIRIIVRP